MLQQDTGMLACMYIKRAFSLLLYQHRFRKDLIHRSTAEWKVSCRKIPEVCMIYFPKGALGKLDQFLRSYRLLLHVCLVA